MKVAVYGTLKKGYGNHPVMERAEAKYIGIDKLYNLQMYTLGGAFPAVVRSNSKDNFILVEVYEVEDDKIKHIDWLEGFNGFRETRLNLYNREAVNTKYGEAQIYLWNHDPYGYVVREW